MFKVKCYNCGQLGYISTTYTQVTKESAKISILGKAYVAFVLQNRNNRGNGLGHLITVAIIQNLATGTNTLKAVIDLGSSFNLVFQIKVKKILLARRDQLKQALYGIDGNSLYTYLEYDLKVFTTNSVDHIVYNNRMFLGADIRGYHIILGRL